MPNYAFRCKCGHAFEKQLKIVDRNDPEFDACPSCGERTVEMMLGATPMGDPVRMGVRRPDKGWSEVLQKIDQTVPGSKIKNNTNYYN